MCRWVLAFVEQQYPKKFILLSPSKCVDAVLLGCAGDKLCLGRRDS